MSYQAPGHGHFAQPSRRPARRKGPLIGWGAALVVAMVAAGIGIWQVDERVYSPGAAAEQYAEALRDGEGPQALGFFSELPEDESSAAAGEDETESTESGSAEPDSTDDASPEAESSETASGEPEPTESGNESGSEGGSEGTESEASQSEETDAAESDEQEGAAPGTPDNVLLEGDALGHSSELMENLQVTGDSPESAGQELSFDVDGEEYTSALPMTHTGNSWGVFDTWKVAPDLLTQFEVEVPGAEAGGIGQVEVNGERVNLHENTATLNAFAPTVADISVDSEWLSGEAREVVVAGDDDSTTSEGSSTDSSENEPASTVSMELEASEAANELLHEEVEEFLTGCAEQQVLMPSGCPMGTSTDNRVDADTISWTMPSAADISLTFDEDGWQVSGEDLSAEVAYEAEDHFDGSKVNESSTVQFSIDVEVGASGDDLIIAVSGD